MVSLAFAAAIAAAQPWQPHSGVSAQATASVRIVSGQRVRFDALSQPQAIQGLPKPRKTKVDVRGTEVPALLVEFS